MKMEHVETIDNGNVGRWRISVDVSRDADDLSEYGASLTISLFDVHLYHRYLSDQISDAEYEAECEDEENYEEIETLSAYEALELAEILIEMARKCASCNQDLLLEQIRSMHD